MAFSTSQNYAETHRLRIEMIDTDLDVAMTFIEIAERNVNAYCLHARELLSKARLAYEATGRFLTEVEDLASYRRLVRRHRTLRKSIRNVERKLQE